jgi:hypothetical protein
MGAARSGKPPGSGAAGLTAKLVLGAIPTGARPKTHADRSAGVDPIERDAIASASAVGCLLDGHSSVGSVAIGRVLVCGAAALAPLGRYAVPTLSTPTFATGMEEVASIADANDANCLDGRPHHRGDGCSPILVATARSLQYAYWFISPHFFRASRTGPSDRPFPVKTYSARGGCCS